MKPNRSHAVDTTTYPTLYDALAARAATHDVGMTFIDERGDERARPWADVFGRAQRRGAWLRERVGLRRGQTVGLALPNDFRFVECLFGAWAIGALPVTLARPGVFSGLSVSRVRHILADSGVDTLLCAREDLADFEELGEDVALVPVDALAAHADLALGDVLAPLPRDAALIQYTSGSTSRPKGVTLTHGNLAANAHGVTANYPYSDAPALASWLPFYHDLGLVGALLASVMRGLPLFVMEPTTFLTDPRIWLGAMSRHGCTLTHVQNLALGHCLRRVRDEDLAALDLSRMQSMFVGSEPVDAALARRFLDRFAAAGLRPDVLTGAYGLAESVVGITRGDPALGLAIDRVDRGALGDGVAEPAAPDHADAIELVCAGTVIEGHELAIMDELGAPLPDRRVGEIWTRGPSVMRGYWGRDDASAEVLVHDDPAGTWLRTGDLGYTVSGRLYVCGRLKELIIVRGKNHHPEDLERAAERVPGVRPGQSVAFSVPSPSGAEQVVLVCETLADDTDALARQVKREVAARTGVKITHVTFQPPHTLPKTTSGKRQRRLVRTTWMRHAS